MTSTAVTDRIVLKTEGRLSGPSWERWLTWVTPSTDPLAFSRRFGWLVVAGLALVIVLPGIGEPAPWIDEGATVLAVRRGWRGLLALAGGPDLTLLTYYLMAKAWTTALWWLPTVVAVRTFSAVAMAVAAAALYGVVVRRAGVLPAALSALLFSTLPSVSRYAQEARPTALLLAFIMLSWLAWDTWRRPVPGSWRPALPGAIRYLVALSGTALVSLFGLFQWPAQVVADLVAGERSGPRLRRALQTIAVMTASLLLVGAGVAFAAAQATGPATPRRIGFDTLYANFAGAVVVTWMNPAMTLLLVLAAVALPAGVIPKGFPVRYRGLVRLAGLWALVPLALGVVAAILSPNLLQTRYWVPVTAPLAILAALGLLILGEAVVRLVSRQVRAEHPPRVAWLAGTVVFVVALSGYAVAVLPVQVAIRQEAGHAESVAPMLAELDRVLAKDRKAVILVSPRSSASILIAVRPELTKRNALVVVDRASSEVWPRNAPQRRIKKALDRIDEVTWVVAHREIGPDETVEPPASLADLGFAVAEAKNAGTWWVVRLVR